MISTNTISSAVTKELGSFFSTEAHKYNDLIRYINSAVNSICMSKNFAFNKYSHILSTDNINSQYTIPYQIETFFILDSWWNEVDYYSFEDYFRLKDKTNAIWIWEETFITQMKWTFTIFYRGIPEQITSLEWSIDIPNHFSDLLIVSATYFWFMDVKAYAKANEKKAVYEWMIKDIAKRSSDPQPLKTKRLNKSKSNIF